jgi:hypothetical protein
VSIAQRASKALSHSIGDHPKDPTGEGEKERKPKWFFYPSLFLLCDIDKLLSLNAADRPI